MNARTPWRQTRSTSTTRCTNGCPSTTGRRHVGVRPHVPHQQLDVHLRQRLPGVLDGPPRARARVLHPTAPTSPTRTTQAGRKASSASTRPVAVHARGRRSSAARSTRTTTARPSPASSTAPASSSTGPTSRAAPAARCTAPPSGRRASARLEARGVLAAAAAPRRPAPTTTATSPTPCASGSAATGVRAARSSTGGAPTTPWRFVDHAARSTDAARRDRRDGRRGPTTARAAYVDRRGTTRVPPPPGRCAVHA